MPMDVGMAATFHYCIALHRNIAIYIDHLDMRCLSNTYTDMAKRIDADYLCVRFTELSYGTT